MKNEQLLKMSTNPPWAYFKDVGCLSSQIILSCSCEQKKENCSHVLLCFTSFLLKNNVSGFKMSNLYSHHLTELLCKDFFFLICFLEKTLELIITLRTFRNVPVFMEPYSEMKLPQLNQRKRDAGDIFSVSFFHHLISVLSTTQQANGTRFSACSLIVIEVGLQLGYLRQKKIKKQIPMQCLC